MAPEAEGQTPRRPRALGEFPFLLDQPITTDDVAVRTAIAGLTADGGGDSPEACAGALEHVDLDAEVGWRPRARRLTIIAGDELPHDDELNSGIPAESQAFASPFSTGVDAGRDAITGTADDLVGSRCSTAQAHRQQ